MKEICLQYGCSKQSFSQWRKAENDIRVNMRSASKREESQKRCHLPAMQNTKRGKEGPARKSARMSHPTQRWSPGGNNIADREAPLSQENEENNLFEHYSDVSKAFPSAASIQHLYTNGFHVYPNLLQVPDEIVQFLKTQNHSQVLFNDGCKKRLMYNFSPEVVGKVSLCSDVADFVNKINDNTVADTWASLWSLSSTLKQPAHFDFDPSKVVHLPDNQKPLLTLVALEDHIYMDVWVGYKLLLDGSLRTPLRSTRIQLNKGDLLVFVADCIHAGSAYDVDNIRLHCYFPVLHTDVPRPDNQTHQVHRLHGEFSFLRGLVDEELSEPVVALRLRHGDKDF